MNKRMRRSIHATRRSSQALLVLALALGSAACAAEDEFGPENEGVEGSEVVISEQQHALLESCNAILMQGVFDELRTGASGSDAFALAKASCREEANSASGGGSFNLFSVVSLGGSGSASSWDKFCQSYKTSSSSTETTSLLVRTASPTIVDAWAKCMTDAGGLACYQKGGENVIALTYRDPNRLGNLARSQITLSNMSMASRTRALAEPNLNFGDTLLAFSIPNATLDSSFVFNGTTSVTGMNQACSVLVKSPRTIKKEIEKTWTDLAIMYRDLGAVVDAVAPGEGAPPASDWRVGAYNTFVLSYWNAAVKSNECASDSPNCTTPPVARDYNYAYTLAAKCPGSAPQKVNGNVLDVSPSQLRSSLQLQAVARDVVSCVTIPRVF